MGILLSYAESIAFPLHEHRHGKVLAARVRTATWRKCPTQERAPGAGGGSRSRRFSSALHQRPRVKKRADVRPRSHATSCWGLTPDEVFGGEASARSRGHIELFDGRLVADRFG